MNWKSLIIIKLLFIFSFAGSNATAQKKITLEDIFKTGTFRVKSVPGFNTMKNEDHYAAISANADGSYSIFQHEVKSSKKGTLLVNTAKVSLPNSKADLNNYSFSEDENKMLLYFNGENIYRRSILYHVVVYNRQTQAFTSIADSKILHANMNPQGTQVAYVKENNLYIFDIASGKTQAITTDGKWNHIINGNCDWVYEEEFSFTQAYQWSPDGKSIAYYRFDESKVKEYAMTKFNNLYPEQYTYKYPKAGEDNATIQIKVYNLATQQTASIDIGSNTDIYIPRIQWANIDELCVLRLNRLQNKLDYLFYNIHSQKTTTELTDENDYYVDIIDPLIFIKDGSEMLFQSEKEGYNQLYILNRINGKVKKITTGNYDVDEVLGYQPAAHKVYFTAGKDSPLERQLYSIALSNNAMTALTKDKGWKKVTAFPSMEKFLVSRSAIDQVPISELIDHKGTLITRLEDNKDLKATMKAYQWGQVQFEKFLAADGKTSLNGWVLYPPDFSTSKSYPVLMYQYSGPGSQEVKNSFTLGNYFWHQYLAQEGYIIVCVDGRGTGARGEAFKKSTYLQLGKYESDDQIAVAQQLQKRAYVAGDRIGIWGWSYGGFMSAICILKGNDVFKTAVSVAPVTNWRLYDNIYTERFMRTPQENAKGYDENSPIDMAQNLKGNLLIIHGTADDNVHFQNAVMLTDALIKANKQFESAYYPDKDHGIYGGNTRYQLFTKITNYIKVKL